MRRVANDSSCAFFYGFRSIWTLHFEHVWAPNVLSVWSMILRHARLCWRGLVIGFQCNLLVGSVIGEIKKVIAVKICVIRPKRVPNVVYIWRQKLFQRRSTFGVCTELRTIVRARFWMFSFHSERTFGSVLCSKCAIDLEGDCATCGVGSKRFKNWVSVQFPYW